MLKKVKVSRVVYDEVTREVCDQCEGNLVYGVKYSIASPFEDRAELALCSSVCFRKYMIGLAALLSDEAGYSVKSMFPELEEG